MTHFNVNDCRRGENAIHHVVADWHYNGGGGTEWYYVQNAQYENFRSAIQNAINGMEAETNIEEYEEEDEDSDREQIIKLMQGF